MGRYIVTGIVTVSVHVEVDAKSAAEAREKAEEADMQTFCYGCARGEPGVWTAGELDGEPKIEEVRKVKP